MTEETQKALITASSTLIGVVIGGFLNPYVQSRRERQKARLDGMARRHTERREALNNAIVAIHNAELATHEAAMSASLSNFARENAKQGFTGLGELMSTKLRDDAANTLLLKMLVEANDDLRRKSNESIEHSITSRLKANAHASEAFAAALSYGGYDGVDGLDSRNLQKDLYDLFAATPGNFTGASKSLDGWRVLAREVAADLGALAACEARCSEAIRAERPFPPKVTLRRLPSLESGIEAIKAAAKEA